MRKKRRIIKMFIGAEVCEAANKFADDFGLVPISIALTSTDNRLIDQLAVIFEVDEERKPK